MSTMEHRDYPWTAALITIVASLFEFHWPILGSLVVTIVVFFIVRKIAMALWLNTPEGRAAQAEVAREEMEAAALARQQYNVNMRNIITAEYYERTGNPDVPDAWLLYRWAELEREAAADQRHLQQAAQQQSIAFQRTMQDAFDTDLIVRSIREDHHRR